jgi:hypothetical protein
VGSWKFVAQFRDGKWVQTDAKKLTVLLHIRADHSWSVAIKLGDKSATEGGSWTRDGERVQLSYESDDYAATCSYLGPPPGSRTDMKVGNQSGLRVQLEQTRAKTTTGKSFTDVLTQGMARAEPA